VDELSRSRRNPPWEASTSAGRKNPVKKYLVAASVLSLAIVQSLAIAQTSNAPKATDFAQHLWTKNNAVAQTGNAPGQ